VTTFETVKGVALRALAVGAVLAATGAPANLTRAEAEPSTSTSTQQVVVTAPSAASTSGTLTAYQQSGGVWHAVYGPVRAELGIHGLSDNRSEGDGTTPAGTYGFGPTMYGLADASPNPRYAYHHLACGDWWSGVRDSTYNTFQQIPCGQTMADSEALWQQTTAYQHFAVITFNMNPTVIGRGSAIFLHDATVSGTTAGCVAVAPTALDAVLSWLDPAQNPVIRIGTTAAVGPPSPLAGAPPAAPTAVRPARPARPATTPEPHQATAAARPRPTAPPTTSPAPTTSTSTTAPTTTTTTVLSSPATSTIRAIRHPASRSPVVVAAAVLWAAVLAAIVMARSSYDTNSHREPL
jgi:L,D-peptidoglycan transpeptidase YkuD (ErfK/YbiS/YcfS/YnhG family)